MEFESKPKFETKVGDWWIGDDFIGIFDTYYDTSEMIKFWQFHHESGGTHHRIGFGKNEPGQARGSGSLRNDHCISPISTFADDGMEPWNKEYNEVVGECLLLYRERFSTLNNTALQQIKINIQRTVPWEGYHVWHCEDNGPPAFRDRILATMMYLNTVPPEDGGETEFLYQSKRFNPVAGRVLIWPAGFTHTHRGNPPLKGEKYIATSWLELSPGIENM